ncbi:S-layer homology domain-containing protein [Flavonifractor sp. AGMB03687]|uniref:S-layer homology domain-containing protein n=1 Tax=Flavonifractor sp. AGMB03687 TaxID=2785133 RepID=UPI001ADFBCDA|nr:S-layer homology domain-containing protein [Flavonifractor sp. AGMB03687]
MKHIRKNWRRFAAVLLSAALMISTVSQTAFAAGADTGKAIQLVDGGTAANISGGQASSVYFGTYPQNSAGSGGYHTDPNESGDVHTHCVCGGNGDVNGHEHDTAATWIAADSLPDSAGNYYLTQSVSGSWTVPTGEVNLCLNGQTISGSITVGSGATLTLTDCIGSGKVQGEVLVNGGKLELYSGTITGGVQVGKKGGTYQTGSSFTMYGGAITGNEDYGGVFLVGTTNHIAPPSFTMHGGTISDNTAGASDGGGGGVYVGEKCSFTMDGGTITGNTATNGNGGGIYIHFNAGNVSISNATITDNKASATGNTSYGHGGGIYSERGVTVKGVTITGNNSTFEGGGIYGKGAITLTDATVTDNNRYDVYYGGQESSAPELTVSGLVKAGYYANNDWKLPILVSGELSEDSVIRVGVYEGIKPNAGGSLLIAEPASGVTLSAENFKADAADSVTSLGEDGKVYLSLCEHEMDDTGYTCKKCHTQFDARIGESAYYQTLAKAFQNAWDGSTITLMRDVNLNGSCSASDTITLDLHGKTITSGDKFFNVNEKLTVKDSSEGGGTQTLNVKFSVRSNGTLAVDDSYTGEISRVELQTGGALEAYTGTIQELLLGKGNGTGYSVKLWKDNAHCCTVKTITLAENADQNLTVGGLLETNHAKCELYGEKGGIWSIVPKTKKISELTGYTAYKVQFPECVHQCDNDTVEKPVCSKCGKVLVVKITATASDGKTRTAWFPADSGIENGDGYVEAIQTLNGWSAEEYTDATLMPLCDVHDGTGGIGIKSVTLTGKLAVDGGEHLINSTTIAAGADVTFKTGQFRHITINGKASFVGGTYLGMVTASSGAEAVFSGGAYQYLKVEDGGTAVVKDSAAFGEDVTVTKGTLTVEGGSFRAAVVVEGDGTMNVNGGSFTGTGKLDRVKYSGGAKGTVSGGSFADLYLYSSGTAWLAGGSFTKLSTADSGVLSSLLADGAAYYDQSGNAISGSGVSELNNVTVKTHTHTVDEQTGICSVCQKQMAASLTAGNETSWYLTLDAAIKAVNEGNGEKTLKLYQDVKTDAPSYELTHGPVTLDVNGKKASGLIITIKGIQLTVTGTGTIRDVTASGSSAVVKNSTVNINYITAENGGRLELGGGSYMGLAVKNDGSSASLSGGAYKKIEWGRPYVPANEYLADGYGYKTSEGTWDDGTGSVGNVTVTPAPIKSTKVYPNSEMGYSGSTFDAKDSTSVTLTVSVTPDESAGLTYIWCRSINDEWRWLTNPSITQGLTEKYTGADSQTLSITKLPAGQTFSYKVQIVTSDGYKCYSEPFTVSTCAHDGDKTLQHDETHHWSVCGKCGAELDRAEHSGGTATCTAKAVCSTCQTAYGELGGHTLTKHDAVDATCTAPGNVEYWHCSVCGKNFSDSIGTGELTEITSPALNHNWGAWTSNGNGTHTRTCRRDSRHTETENCSGGSATCTNAAICTSCRGSYGKELGHDWGEWKNTSNAQQHTRTCRRDQSHTETAAHTPGTPANCTTPQTCTACGYEITPANNNHDWNAWESNGNGTHTHTCKNDSSHTETTNCSGGSATCEAQAVCDVCHMVYGELAPHTLTHTPAVDATCTTPGNVEYWHCSVCNKNFSDSEGKGELTEITSPALNHNWGAWEKVSETQHQRICQNDGSHKETGDHTPGTAATCKAPANCSICGQSYGEKNPSNHTGGTEVRNQKEATTTTEGYTGDTYCLGCGEKIASGMVIPKLPSSGGGSSSGGGGGSSTPSVTIPVSSDHGGAKLSATISGSTATVSVSGKEIDKVIADGAKSVTVDLSGLSKVDSVKLPASIIAKTEDAEDTRLTIRLPDGAVELDEAALESIASGKTVTVSVQQANLTDAQQEAVSALAQVAVVVDVDIVVGTVKQSAFNGGRLTISIPYIPEKGEDTSTLAVWYIRDNGSIENKGGSYDAKSGCFVFETDHLSRYLLVHTEQVMGFTDVPANSWYAGAVAWAVEQGITSGTSDTTFSPNVSCTRAQMVTFLWRASGTPEIGTTSPFSDVSADAYYYDAVLWAIEQGITGGTGDGKFSPDAPCTRAQMATFLWRANGSPEVTGTTPFSDVSAGTYYCNAVLWAYEQNITNGTGGGKFSPDAPCTRAQMVQMLKNASDAA